MTDLIMNMPAGSLHRRAGIAALAVLAMTAVHHVYGAVIYDTPFRLHIVFVAVPVALFIAFALRLGAARAGTKQGRLATWAAVAVILVFAVAAIGVFEGGYNHFVKNIAYLGGGEAAVRVMMPSWLYDPAAVEIPNDIVFEATGIAQFPLSIWAAIETWRLARRTAG
jgi:hypothetical protein